jgi:hypothetical protein
MPETKPNTAKLHGGGGREFARQGAAIAKDVSENTTATAEETTTALEKTYSIVATGAADNTNSTLDFVQRLFSVRSPAEFLELSSAHYRTQSETFAEQSRHLTSMAQKMTTHAVEPLKAGMKSALSNTA